MGSLVEASRERRRRRRNDIHFSSFFVDRALARKEKTVTVPPPLFSSTAFFSNSSQSQWPTPPQPRSLPRPRASRSATGPSTRTGGRASRPLRTSSRGALPAPLPTTKQVRRCGKGKGGVFLQPLSPCVFLSAGRRGRSARSLHAGSNRSGPPSAARSRCPNAKK